MFLGGQTDSVICGPPGVDDHKDVRENERGASYDTDCDAVHQADRLESLVNSPNYAHLRD